MYSLAHRDRSCKDKGISLLPTRIMNWRGELLDVQSHDTSDRYLP